MQKIIASKNSKLVKDLEAVSTEAISTVVSAINILFFAIRTPKIAILEMLVTGIFATGLNLLQLPQ